MKLFDISDVLTVTTGRLVSSRHMEGVYEILNFLTGDDLYTHQLPRAMDECGPWLRNQFPELMKDSPRMVSQLQILDERLKSIEDKGLTEQRQAEQLSFVIKAWIEDIQTANNLPHYLPVYEMGADMHTRINPVGELEAMVGKDRMIVVAPNTSGSS